MKSVSPPPQVAELIGKYTPEIARAFTASRRKIRAWVPRGYELVYDNYNALGIGYGPGQKASDVILSMVAYPRWVTLFFSQALAPHAEALAECPRIQTVVKSVAAKQRPRRPPERKPQKRKP
jgi:hypothetical protein